METNQHILPRFMEKFKAAEFWMIAAETTACWERQKFGLENRKKKQPYYNDDIYLAFSLIFVLRKGCTYVV